MHTYIFGSVFISLGVWFAFKNISIEMMSYCFEILTNLKHESLIPGEK